MLIIRALTVCDLWSNWQALMQFNVILCDLGPHISAFGWFIFLDLYLEQRNANTQLILYRISNVNKKTKHSECGP